MNINTLKFDNKKIETAAGSGLISTLDFDLDVTAEPVQIDHKDAPTHRIMGKSPRGHDIECGGIWKKKNKQTGEYYFTLSIRGRNFNANLGKAAFQDDDSLQAIIPWGPKEPSKAS